MKSANNKQKIATKKILERRMARDESQGGILSLTIGAQGEGKTSQMLHESKTIMDWYPNELIIWRDSFQSAAQFNRIGDNWQIFAERGCNLRFRNLTSGGYLKIKYITFNNFNELINQDTGKGLMKPQQLNVLYFKHEYTWIDFLCHLRETVGWQSAFFDEIEDVIPLNPPKEQYDRNLLFSNNAKQIRKGLVNMFCNTQNMSDIDWRFKSKIMMRIYLNGSKVDPRSQIKQVAVNKLKKGLGFVDWNFGSYGKLKFKSYPPRKPVFEVIINDGM